MLQLIMMLLKARPTVHHSAQWKDKWCLPNRPHCHGRIIANVYLIYSNITLQPEYRYCLKYVLWD
jgi:hypothetical protein